VSEVEETEENEFDLFMACREAQGDAPVPSAEIDKYFEITKEPDTSARMQLNGGRQSESGNF
jgi:hypothetical protein